MSIFNFLMSKYFYLEKGQGCYRPAERNPSKKFFFLPIFLYIYGSIGARPESLSFFLSFFMSFLRSFPQRTHYDDVTSSLLGSLLFQIMQYQDYDGLLCIIWY